MINGIKSFSSAKQEEDTTVLFDDGLVEELVDGDDVFGTVLPAKKPL